MRPYEIVLYMVTALAVVAATFMALSWAPTEATMGHVQRIFYFHVATAWVGFFAFFVTFLAGIFYLWQGQIRWDHLAASSEEIGFVFISMALISGSVWARPVWNTWWTWEPRLTTSAVLWLIYMSYLLLRASLEDPARRARFAAVYGLVGFVSVPITFMAIRWWRTVHPVILQSGGFALTGKMLVTLLASVTAFTLLYVVLLRSRLGLAKLEELATLLEGKIEGRER